MDGLADIVRRNPNSKNIKREDNKGHNKLGEKNETFRRRYATVNSQKNMIIMFSPSISCNVICDQ